MAIAEILKNLVEHEVEFVIVGGMAAVLQGAPVTTLDLDIVYHRSPENVARILAKEHLGRPKDRAMLVVLRATLDEKQRPR